ncbi:hypothetical protein D3C85_1144150 [compost metagenome]
MFYNIFHYVHADIAVYIFTTGFNWGVEHFRPHKIFKEALFNVIVIGYLGRVSGRRIPAVVAGFNIIVKRDVRNKPCLVQHYLTHLNVVHRGGTCFRDICTNIGIQF